jgi:hypothetical protein
MDCVNAYICASFDGDHGAIWLLDADPMIANYPVNSPVWSRPILWKTTDSKDRPLLKLEPIPSREDSRIVRILRITEQLVFALDLGPEFFE